LDGGRITRIVKMTIKINDPKSKVNYLTPWSRVLLKKLTASQLVKKSTAFYGNRRFSAMFTRARHWSLS